MCVCVCVSSLLSSSKMIEGACLSHIRSIMVVSRSPPHKSVCTSPTRLKSEEPPRRRRSGRYCQVLSSHSEQVWKLLLMLLHQRVCVVGHLLDLHVRLKLGFSFDRGHVEIHGCGTIPKSSSKSLRCLASPPESFTSIRESGLSLCV